MLNKKIILISILILSLLTISFVSATENVIVENENLINTQYSPNENIISTENEKISEENNEIDEIYTYEEKLSLSDGSFEELANEIDKAKDILNLVRDYKRYNEMDVKAININKNIEINGNGHELDGIYLGTIFYIHDGDITLKNITFTRGKYSYGGAIHIVKGNVKIIDCKFKGNYVEKKGCDIYSERPNSLYIKGTSFEGNNEVSSENGLVYLKGSDICIDNCKFKNGGISYSGSTGLIISGTNVTIKNCNFNRTGFARVLSIKGKNITLLSCKFIINSECINIDSADLTSIKNCYFKNNNDVLIKLGSKLLLYNSTFDNNFNNTLVDCISSNDEIINCKFLENRTFDKLFKYYNNFTPILINNTGFGSPTKITIDKLDLCSKDDFMIYLKDMDNKPLYSKKIIVDIDKYHYENFTQVGKGYNLSPKGYVPLNISNIDKEGKYFANIYFAGDKEYEPSSLQILLDIKFKRTTHIDVKNILSYQPNISFKESLTGENILINNITGVISYKTEELPGRNIRVNINNITYTLTNNNILSLFLKPGSYEVNSYYEGDEIYDSCSVKSIITIMPSIILNDFKNEYENNIELNVQFLNKNGNLLNYETVLFNMDGIDEILITNSEGVINFNKQLSVGSHTLKIVNTNTKEEIFKTILIKEKINNPTQPADSSKPVNKIILTLKKVKVKQSTKKLFIQATLKINGKAVKNKWIKFKFNKKNYKAKTNAKGVAKITVKKAVLKKLKIGKKVTYTATYDKVTKKITVKVKK